MNKVLAMKPGLGKIMEKTGISRNFESPKTDQQIAANACCIDDTDTWMSKQVYFLLGSKS